MHYYAKLLVASSCLRVPGPLVRLLHGISYCCTYVCRGIALDDDRAGGDQ